MIPESVVRALLIDSCHSSSEAVHRLTAELSSPEFVEQLVEIAVDADDQQGDAPMQAAYFLSQASPAHTRSHEKLLLALLSTADGYSGHVARALGRMKSGEAKPIIARMLAEGSWPEQAYRDALAFYDVI
jgi:hypothetical protein